MCICVYTYYIYIYIYYLFFNKHCVLQRRYLGENFKLFSSILAHADSVTYNCSKSKQSAKFCFYVHCATTISNILLEKAKTVLKPDTNDSEQL